MAPKLAVLLLFLGAVATAIYLAIRLHLFGLRNRHGLGAFLSGLTLILCALLWQVMTLNPSYTDWFVPGAYTVAVIVQALVAALGVFLCGAGIVRHDQYWREERRNLLRREQLLSLLENLQHDARQPYQLLELLNISLREIVTQMPESCGAIFFTNRTRRQFVLTAWLGLAKDEIASLEHYPLERNIVSQAVNSAEPLIAPGFDFIEPDGSLRPSRFAAVLVLPLVAGMEQIGGLVLFSTVTRRFNRDDARILTPVTEWLAERIRATRLSRELTAIRTERDRLSAQFQALHDRVGAAISSLNAPDPLGAFCRSLVGLFESGSVHICSMRSDRMEFLSHSGPIGELSQSYQTALIEAIDRKKPLLINQESTDESGRDRIVASTLVVPLGENHPASAILLRRDAGTIVIADPSMHTVELLSRMAALAVDFVEVRHRSLSQRTGFERIMRLLNPAGADEGDSPEWFVRELQPAFPPSTGFLVLAAGSDAKYRAVHAVNMDDALVSELVIRTTEGKIDPAQSGQTNHIVGGKADIGRWLELFHLANRQILSRIIGSDLEHTLIGVCPLRGAGGLQTILIVARNVSERSRDEYARLLTLACALYGFRSLLAQKRMPQAITSGKTVAEDTASSSEPSTEIATGVSQVLARAHISGDLYMIAGRPREIHARLQPAGAVKLEESLVMTLVETALDGFSAGATDDDVITLSLYQDQSHVYLDFSRHRRHFPPVEQVAGFASYRHIKDARSDAFSQAVLAPLASLAGREVWYATDLESPSPTFLSFKLPKKQGPEVQKPALPVNSTPRILVIDDQPVILDLVSAMCQTIGYSADCARSGEIGLQLAGEHDYTLVLVDLAMPGLSGLEVARLLHRRKPDLPVIVMTGWEASLDRTALADAGIVEVLYKPFRIEQLGDLLKSLAGPRPTR
jgi:CheY-like chemotaxis protein/GAF domain-containing protein